MVSAMGDIRCILGVAPRVCYGWHDTIDLQTAHEYALVGIYDMGMRWWTFQYMLYWDVMSWAILGKY